jgi:hypothetical protein
MGIIKNIASKVNTRYMKAAAKSGYGRALKDISASGAVARKRAKGTGIIGAAIQRNHIKTGMKSHLQGEATKLYKRDVRRVKIGAAAVGTTAVGGVGVKKYKQKKANQVY